MKPSTALVLPDMSYAVLSFVKSDKKSHVGAKTRSRPARLLERLRHHRSSADRRLYEPRTAHVLPDMSYAVLSFVKSDKKSHVGAKTRSRPARLLERLRHHRSSADRRMYEPRTAHVLPDMSYAVLSFVKSDKKSQVGAKTRSRPARLLERLRHHRSSADRRMYEPRTAHVLPDMSYA
ncbi:hypothetical protein PF010_g30855, partial [Phytophthora fragariae]